jgi:hypothetical protein
VRVPQSDGSIPGDDSQLPVETILITGVLIASEHGVNIMSNFGVSAEEPERGS